MQVINWELISHPLNWVILFLMVFIAMLFVSVVLNNFGSPAAVLSGAAKSPAGTT